MDLTKHQDIGVVALEEGADRAGRTDCWADPLSQEERRILREKLARAATASFWARTTSYRPELGRWEDANANAVAEHMQTSSEMADLHLDVTERAAVHPRLAYRHPTADARFVSGDKAVWKGMDGNLHREVTIEGARSAYAARHGQRPEDGQLVYDINDPVIGGTVFSIPADQLGPVPAETGAAR